MEKLGLKTYLDALKGNKPSTENFGLIVNAEYDELFTSAEWFNEIITFLKKTNSSESAVQLLLSLCRFCQSTFHSERIDIDTDLKRRVVELGERVVECQSVVKQYPQFAGAVYASEAAFYLFAASVNLRASRKNRHVGGRSTFDNYWTLLALSYDTSSRAASHFIETSASASTSESKILVQAERLNALTSCITGTMIVERIRMMQQNSRSATNEESWTASFPNVLADSQACLKKTLDLKDDSRILSSLSFSTPNAMLSSCVPNLPDLLPLFEHVLATSLDLQALIWCVVYLRRLFPISTGASHQYTDAFAIEALVKGEAMRRCSHLPSALAGDFSSPSADALCQLDVVAFILIATARVELALRSADQTADDILPPFVANCLGSCELGGDSFWLTSSQANWWRAVMLSTEHRQQQQALQDPFAKFRLIQDGLFLLRLSALDAKLLHLALRVAESLQAFVLEHYFTPIHNESDWKFALSPDVRRFHIYCCKYWNSLLHFVQTTRSTSHGHHSQRVSLGCSTPPSRQQRFFEPLPSGLMESFSGSTVSSEMRNRICQLSNCYLGFDAFLSSNYDTSVKLLKTCSNELVLASFFEGRAFEAMAEEAQDKNDRLVSSSTSSSWVIRQLYESALTAYERAVTYNQTGAQQVKRAVVVDAASKSAARIKKKLLGSRRDDSSTTVQRVVATAPVNGGSVDVAGSQSPVSYQQQQTMNTLIHQQQEQSLSVLNNTVGQLVPAIRDLTSAARDLADVARQLRELERQLRESVVRMDAVCTMQLQSQRSPSSAATATPPISVGGTQTGVTADQLLPLLTDLIRECIAPFQASLPYMPPNVSHAQPNMLMQQSLAGHMPPPLSGFRMPPQALDPQFPHCAMLNPQFPQQPPPQSMPPSAFSPLVGPDAKPLFPPSQPVPPMSSAPAQMPPMAIPKDQKTAETKPAATTTPKPATQEKSLADMFKPAPGSWSCSTCLVRNKEGDERCVACEQPRPGTAPPVSKPLPQISFPPPSQKAAEPVIGASLFPKPNPSGVQFTIPSGSPSFGAPKPSTPATSAATSSVPSKPIFGFATNEPPKGAKEKTVGEEDPGESPEEFVPTAEYQPVAQLPSNYEVVTGEENEDNLFSDRAKLYRWADTSKEWKERGVGEMKVLKNKATGRSRVLMRREQVLKPCANHYITKEMELRPFTAVGDRGFLWIAADFAEVEAGEEPQILKLAVRFRNAETAQQFKKVFESSRNAAAESKSPAKIFQPVQSQGPKAESTKPVPTPAEASPIVSVATAPVTSTHSATKPPDAPTTTAPATSTQSGLPLPIFGSTAAKPSSNSSGLFSFAALAAANPKPSEDDSAKPAGSSPFVGKPEPLFKSLASKSTPPAVTSGAGAKDTEGGDETEKPESFVPTSEYAPVIQLPSDYKHVSGEEGFQKVFSERCKLYRWDDNTKEWKERGIGDIRLIKATDGSEKHRIVMRREHIHTVCANHYLTITPPMRLGRLPSAADRAVTWRTANDYADGEAKAEMLCVRFKAAASADQFTACFRRALDELEKKYGSESDDKNGSPPQQPAANENSKPPSEEKQSETPKFSFKDTAQTATPPVLAKETTAPGSSSLFNASALSNAVKSPSNNAPAANNSTPFSGFRFGQLGGSSGASDPKPAGSSPFGGGGSVFGGGANSGSGFSFTGVFPTAASGSKEKPAALKGTEGEKDDDCQLVCTEHATPDEVAKARQYLLPDDFYLYRLRKPCAGCAGCDDENNENISNSAVSNPSGNISNSSGKAKQGQGKSNPTSASAFKSQIPTPPASFSSR